MTRDGSSTLARTEALDRSATASAYPGANRVPWPPFLQRCGLAQPDEALPSNSLRILNGCFHQGFARLCVVSHAAG
jgi:hypothetical protein